MAETIKEVMTADPITIQGTSTVEEAAQLMKTEDIGDVMVVDKDDKLTGILTDRDIVIRGAAGGADLKTVKVKEIVSKELKTVGPNSSIDDAVALMRSEAVRRLPVVENGKLLGIVTLGDLAVERDPNSALAEISAASPDQAGTSATSMNGRKAGMELGKALPAVAFGATLALAMNQVRGRSRRKTVAIAAKKLRRAGKKLHKSGDKIGADAASRAAEYVSRASKEIRKSGKKIADESTKQFDSKVTDIKRMKAQKKAEARSTT